MARRSVPLEHGMRPQDTTCFNYSVTAISTTLDEEERTRREKWCVTIVTCSIGHSHLCTVLLGYVKASQSSC